MCSHGVCITGDVRLDMGELHPSLSIDKKACPGSGFKQGDPVWFQIDVTNTGLENAYNVKFTDYRPSEITLTNTIIEPAGKNITINTGARPISAFIDVVAPGEKVSIKFSGSVAMDAFMQIENRACIEHTSITGTNNELCDAVSMDLGCESCNQPVILTLDKSTRSTKTS